jgi:deoxyadenosine/deoxycytidine kinase
MDTPDHVFTIVVEGNIGAGKTTFLNHFRDISIVDVYEEPVNKWRNCRGHNLLQQMYDDPVHVSPTFQSYVLLTMLEQHRKKSTRMVKIMERSISSAKHCFMKQLLNTNMMKDSDHAVLSEWFEYIERDEQLDTNVDLIIYLQTDPTVAYQRLLERNRSEECTVPYSHISDIHALHEDWLVGSNPRSLNPVPVLILDGNKDISNYKLESDIILTEIYEYLSIKKSILRPAISVGRASDS